MKLTELLEEAKIGRDSYKRLRTTEFLQSLSEENKLSSILVNAMENLNENTAITESLMGALDAIKTYEDRKNRSVRLQESFLRKQYDAIKYHYVELLENVNKAKDIKDEENVSKAIALINYVFEDVFEQFSQNTYLPEFYLEESVFEEYSLLREIL